MDADYPVGLHLGDRWPFPDPLHDRLHCSVCRVIMKEVGISTAEIEALEKLARENRPSP